MGKLRGRAFLITETARREQWREPFSGARESLRFRWTLGLRLRKHYDTNPQSTDQLGEIMQVQAPQAQGKQMNPKKNAESKLAPRHLRVCPIARRQSHFHYAAVARQGTLNFVEILAIWPYVKRIAGIGLSGLPVGTIVLALLPTTLPEMSFFSPRSVTFKAFARTFSKYSWAATAEGNSL
jgi:hypothetical protein